MNEAHAHRGVPR